MIEINLIPDVKQELIRAQRTRSTVITGSIFVGIASISVVVVLAVYVFGVQTARNLFADSSITSGIKKLQDVSDLQKTLTIQNQLSKITALNGNKKVDSRLFEVLGAVIPPAPNDIMISSISIDSDSQTIVIEGQAVNSYSAVEIFKKTIEGAVLKYTKNDKASQVNLASDISISDTSYGADSSGSKVLRFTMSFVYANELFSPSSINTSIAIIVDGNVTDSYLGIPKSIFVDRAADITEGQ